MPALAHCTYRRVDLDGAILCDRIKQGDREIKADLCRTCPVAVINCTLLRATLTLHSRPPIRVRYGNGKTDIWAGEDPTLSLDQAACSEKVIPIISPHECSGCHLRQSLAQPPARASRSRANPIPAPSPTLAAPTEHPARTARPIIRFAPWLEQTRPTPRPLASAQAARPSRRPPSPPSSFAEEKRAGRTD